VLAALLPTIDPLSLILESVPMYLLYELSILMASAWGRPIGDVADQPAPEGTG
jgi:Sec-independent protein secretion pathway component TatC